MQKLLEQKIIDLDGVTCTACENKIEKALSKLDGVDFVKVSFSSSTVDIIYNRNKIDLDTIYDTIEKTGYDVIYDDASDDGSNITTILILLIIAGLYVIINNTVGFNDSLINHSYKTFQKYILNLLLGYLYLYLLLLFLFCLLFVLMKY